MIKCKICDKEIGKNPNYISNANNRPDYEYPIKLGKENLHLICWDCGMKFNEERNTEYRLLVPKEGGSF